MAVPYPRSFNSGRQSDLLYDDELHQIIESVRHVAEKPGENKKPKGKLSGSLFMNQEKNQLESYYRDSDEWRPVFKEKFQIIDGITNILPDANPVKGQLWIYNGVLCYWDGNAWKPVKALAQDAGEFDLSLFEDFLLVCPLHSNGHTVVQDDDIAAFKEARRQYLLNKIDAETGSEFNGDGSKWKVGDTVNYKEIDLPSPPMLGKAQYIVPNINVDRVFTDHHLDDSYEIVNPYAIQFYKDYVKDRTVSCVHINPGKLTKITKRLFKVDRVNPRIPQPTFYTEFYGFQANNVLGDFLLPEREQDDGGYFTDNNDKGIILSYDQCQNYDYVLAITYEFAWMKATGKMTYVDSRKTNSAFYVQNFMGPSSLFIDGYEIGNDAFVADSLTKTILMNENVNGREVEAMHTIRREFGFVRQVDLKNHAVIETVQDYRRPLIFMNGEAMNTSIGDVIAYNRDLMEVPTAVADRKLGRFEVANGKMNMCWTVVELCDRASDGNGKSDIHHDYDMFESEGYVPAPDENGEVYIPYTSNDIQLIQDDQGNLSAGHIVLFVDGLLVNRKDIWLDTTKKKIFAPGLKPGQDYILLKDKYDYFADQDKMLPAVNVDRLTDSLVYLNGHLLCEDRQLITTAMTLSSGLHNEVRLFPEAKMARVYNATKGEWSPPSTKLYDEVMTFADAYKNSTRAIQYHIPVGPHDRLQVYAFNCANDYSNTITIENYHTPIVPTYIGNSTTKTPSNEIILSGDYAGQKIVTLINNELVPYQSVERVPYGTGYRTKIKYSQPQLGTVRAIVYPQMIPIAQKSIYPFECYEVYLNGIRQYGHKNDLLAEGIPSEVWDGDAPEIAPNGRHYFEKDIWRLTSGTDFLTRAEAIALLALDPKYRDAAVDKSYINAAYTIETTENGTFIKFDVPICGLVTYVVHPPETGKDNVGKQFFMDATNAVQGAENAYTLGEGESFYPGRTVVYVNGVRQSQDSYTLLNNKTIMFLDQNTPILGNGKNFRAETVTAEDGSKHLEYAEYCLNDEGNIVRLQHKHSDRIMIEVRDDYGWKEAHFKLKRTKDNFKIVLDQYDLTASLLETTDEIKIYVDGSFFGLKKDQGYRKVIDVMHPTLEIIDADVIERLTSDPMLNYLQEHPEEMLAYKNTHNGEEYLPPAKDIILEWR